MKPATRTFVQQRADDRCEYCRLRQDCTRLPHHVEHIVAQQHGGGDDPGNLALSCARCNLCKGPNLTGIDPQTGQMAPLFHPRSDAWSDHFTLEGAAIVGVTPTGRATVSVLAMNENNRLQARKALIARGLYP